MSGRSPHWVVAVPVVVFAHLVLLAMLWRERSTPVRDSGTVMIVSLRAVRSEPESGSVAPTPTTTEPRSRARSTGPRPIIEPRTAPEATRSGTRAVTSHVPVPSAGDGESTDAAAVTAPADATPPNLPPLRLPRLSDLARSPRGASWPAGERGELAAALGRLREEDRGDGRRRIHLDGRCWDTAPSRASQLDPAGMSPSARDLRQVRPCS